MNRNKKEIIHIYPSKKQAGSGVYKYNYYLSNLLSKNYKLKKIFINYENKMSKYFILFYKLFQILLKSNSKNSIYIITPDESFILSNIFSFFSKIRFVNIIHDYRKYSSFGKSNFLEFLRLKFLEFNYFFLKFSYKIIVPSNFTFKKIKKKHNIKICIVPNLFNKKINNFKNIKNPNNKKINLLLISSDDSYKNVLTIIKSCQILKDKVFLKWVAKINFLKNYLQLKKIISNNNLPVKIYKNCKDKFIISLINSCDIFLAPSLYEGFGRTAIEAQIYNKKILCSDIEINREILKKTAYYVKNPLNENEWASMIIKINNKSKKSQKNYKRFINNAKQIRKYSNILKDFI